jgi:polyisoprenoid-binding protein YceI
MSTTAVKIPGYVAGTYTIDPGHSDVAFTARHVMVNKVRGHFTRFQGELTLNPDPLASSVTATIELASIDTNPHATATCARPTSSRPTPTRR